MYAEAAEAYAGVVSLAPDNSRGHGNLGSSLMMIGDFEGAARALQRSIALEPRKTYYSNLGIIYYYLGRFDESVSIHRQAIEESPDQNYVWLNLGDAQELPTGSTSWSGIRRSCSWTAAKLRPRS